MNRRILDMLNPRTLVAAYCRGVFPMVERDELYWFSPDPRGLLPMDGSLHVPRRLGRTIRSGRFVCTVDRCFGRVVRRCARRPDGGETWISPEVVVAYTTLHEMGLAHSFEAWEAGAEGEGEPAGGLYGVALGGAFFGESMFTRVTDAGKVALVTGLEHLRRGGFALFDIQWTTPHLERFGAFDVPRSRYLTMLARALRLRPRPL